MIHAGNLGDDLIAGGSESLRACYRGALALTLASYHERSACRCSRRWRAERRCSHPRRARCRKSAGMRALCAAGRRRSVGRRFAGIVDDAPLRERLREAGLERVKRFSWDESVRRHMALFRAVVL